MALWCLGSDDPHMPAKPDTVAAFGDNVPPCWRWNRWIPIRSITSYSAYSAVKLGDIAISFKKSRVPAESNTNKQDTICGS